MAIPKDTVIPSSSGQFAKIQDGDNRFRFLSDVVVGWEGWKDKKPFRREGAVCKIKPEEVDLDKNGKSAIKYFWASIVYNYNEKRIQILELTQKTLMEPLFELEKSEDWGDLKNYDVVIKKSGAGLDTEYSIIPVAPKPLALEVEQAYKDSHDKIKLESLFETKASEEVDPLSIPF